MSMGMRFATTVSDESKSAEGRPMTIEARIGKGRTRIITVPADSLEAELARDADRTGKSIATMIDNHRVTVLGRVF